MFEALQYEKDRNGGRLSPFGYSSFTVGAAVDDVKAMEVSFAVVFVLLYCIVSSSHGRPTGFFSFCSGSTSCRIRANCKLVRKASTFVPGDGEDITYK